MSPVRLWKNDNTVPDTPAQRAPLRIRNPIPSVPEMHFMIIGLRTSTRYIAWTACYCSHWHSKYSSLRALSESRPNYRLLSAGSCDLLTGLTTATCPCPHHPSASLCVGSNWTLGRPIRWVQNNGTSWHKRRMVGVKFIFPLSLSSWRFYFFEFSCSIRSVAAHIP